MMMNFKTAPLLRRCLSGAAAAAAAVCLSSCGGGGSGDADTSARPDISPHKLVPVENDTAVIYIRGVVLCDTGWEMGSSVDDRNPGPADGLPGRGLDDTETMLTLYFQPNGEFTMDLPFSSFADDAANDATRAAQAQTRNVRVENGHWWQTNTAENTHNMVLGIYFEASDTGEDAAGGSALNPMGYIRWEYRGENLCLHLRTRTNAPSMLGMYRFDGAVASGKMYVKSLRNEVTASFGGGQSTLLFEDEYNFWGEPAIYFPGAAWSPGENDPLDPILE